MKQITIYLLDDELSEEARSAVLTWLHDSLTAKLRATYPLEVSIRFIKCYLKTDGFETDEMHEKVPKKSYPFALYR
jgi:hypothetical protein